MPSQITSLKALSCFRTAAELQSFSKAADQLNLTHGAISRAVRLLEDDLKTQLFIRRNRSVFLTEEGRRLAHAVAYGLDHIEDAIERIKADRFNAKLTVSCEPTLMMRWLIPRLPDFRQAHPSCDIQLVAGGGPVPLGDRVDIAIRRNDFPIPNTYQSQVLFEEWIGPVCRPDLKADFFENAVLRSNAPLLNSRTRPNAWADWTNAHAQTHRSQSETTFEHFYFSLQAAVAGIGVAIGPWLLVHDDVKTGILVAPAGFIRDGSHYVLLRLKGREESKAETAFVEWLSSLAQDHDRPGSKNLENTPDPEINETNP